VVWALLGGQPAGGPGGPSRSAGAPSSTATYVSDSHANHAQRARIRHVVEATVAYASSDGSARFLGRAPSPVVATGVAADTAAELPQGYSSFSAAKRAMGSPGEGNVFDHVVEQSQIGRSGFAPEEIHNPFNMHRPQR